MDYTKGKNKKENIIKIESGIKRYINKFNAGHHQMIIQDKCVHFNFVLLFVPIFLRKRKKKKLETLKLREIIEKK